MIYNGLLFVVVCVLFHVVVFLSFLLLYDKFSVFVDHIIQRVAIVFLLLLLLFYDRSLIHCFSYFHLRTNRQLINFVSLFFLVHYSFGINIRIIDLRCFRFYFMSSYQHIIVIDILLIMLYYIILYNMQLLIITSMIPLSFITV